MLSKPVVQVDNLKKVFVTPKKQQGVLGSFRSLIKRDVEEVTAVKDVSFSIQKGELVGFIGPNGAGKTTTLKCLSGLLYPTSGIVSVLGWTPVKRRREFLMKIALVMGQKNQLWWDLPAIETFALNKEIYEIPDRQYHKTLNDLSDLLDVGKLLTTQVRKLSLGERMKMELIAALIHQPDVLFLDEPTIGLDVVMQKQLRDFLASYNRKFESTILLTSHYMEDVKQLAKRVMVIDKGSLVFDGKLEKLVSAMSKEKLVTFGGAQKIPKEQLSKFGTLINVEGPTVSLRIPREKVPQTILKLIRSYKVADLTVTELDIEDIIREVFRSPELLHAQLSEEVGNNPKKKGRRKK